MLHLNLYRGLYYAKYNSVKEDGRWRKKNNLRCRGKNLKRQVKRMKLHKKLSKMP